MYRMRAGGTRARCWASHGNPSGVLIGCGPMRNCAPGAMAGTAKRSERNSPVAGMKAKGRVRVRQCKNGWAPCPVQKLEDCFIMQVGCRQRVGNGLPAGADWPGLLALLTRGFGPGWCGTTLNSSCRRRALSRCRSAFCCTTRCSTGCCCGRRHPWRRRCLGCCTSYRSIQSCTESTEKRLCRSGCTQGGERMREH